MAWGRRSRAVAAVTVATFTVATLALGVGGVAASTAHNSVVSEDPVNFTPNVEDDSNAPNAAVHAFARSGDTMYAGGAFRKVTNAAGSQTFTRYNIMAFNATTGAMKSFAPQFNGTVWAIRAKGSALYVGGDFTTVNGVARRGLAKIDATTGQLRTKFKPAIAYGNVSEIRLFNKRLIVGGSFPKRLAALRLRTGADTGYLNLNISGRIADNSGPTKVYRFALSQTTRRLVAIGNFTSAGGKSREHAFMVRLGRKTANVTNWYYAPLHNKCSGSQAPAYLRDVDFSPDGSYFVIASTGFIPTSGGVGRDLCDAAARFETDIVTPYRPTWINYTGGDTLHSIAATGAAVYVQGHQRWLDNPWGVNDAGPGAVSREGIGAINPTTGEALSWDPGKSREVGGRELFATPQGLWVGSDGARFSGEYRHGIAFVPLP
jgi:hypothetical protein